MFGLNAFFSPDVTSLCVKSASLLCRSPWRITSLLLTSKWEKRPESAKTPPSPRPGPSSPSSACPLPWWVLIWNLKFGLNLIRCDEFKCWERLILIWVLVLIGSWVCDKVLTVQVVMITWSTAVWALLSHTGQTLHSYRTTKHFCFIICITYICSDTHDAFSASGCQKCCLCR